MIARRTYPLRSFLCPEFVLPLAIHRIENISLSEDLRSQESRLTA